MQTLLTLRKKKSRTVLLTLALVVGLSYAGGTRRANESPATFGVIVQAKDVQTARELARSVGATITHELRIINAVGVQATPRQAAKLGTLTGARVYREGSVKLAGPTGFIQNSFYPTQIGADRLHASGTKGQGVTVAILDTGAQMKAREYNEDKVLVSYDAIKDAYVFPDKNGGFNDDNGHGTHVASVMLSGLATSSGKFNGVAPGARLAIVKAFNAQGRGTYADVIRGIDWVVGHAHEYNIRVLNCSFSATPQSHYWDDPINQAIMRAWQLGIVVVASAGNTGPTPMTVGVPGNVPYVITVGAFTDSYTPTLTADDKLTSFSAAGPTHEGFMKPEVLAPGGHILGMMRFTSQLAIQHPEFHAGSNADVPYFAMSGTSQAAAVVSGAAALLLQARPQLSPDGVKCRLMATARPFRKATGALAYSVFQQGAGNINVYDATRSTVTGCANVGLDIDSDLSGADHYSGGARYDSTRGTYYVDDVNAAGYSWNAAYSWNAGYSGTQGYGWNTAYGWNQGFGWNTAYSWNNTFGWNAGFAWNSSFGWNAGYMWRSGFTAGTAAPQSINVWVNQQ